MACGVDGCPGSRPELWRASPYDRPAGGSSGQLCALGQPAAPRGEHRRERPGGNTTPSGIASGAAQGHSGVVCSLSPNFLYWKNLRKKRLLNVVCILASGHSPRSPRTVPSSPPDGFSGAVVWNRSCCWASLARRCGLILPSTSGVTFAGDGGVHARDPGPEPVVETRLASEQRLQQLKKQSTYVF